MVPTQADVLEAAEWLAGRVVRTPVVSSAELDQQAGGRRLWLKAENLQRSGSYKFRGAMRSVGRLAERGCPGVIAQSTGNHAIAIALAAREHGMLATAVLPVDAPRTKIELAEAYGARIMLAGHTVEERLIAVRGLTRETGQVAVDAYDHPDVICGQATAALELLDEVARQGSRLSTVVVPVGGGGGVAGTCLAVQGLDVAVYGVEPEGCDSMARSLEQGRPISVVPQPTVADGLRPARVGDLPFEIVRKGIAGVVRVTDAEIERAMRLALWHAKLLVEPSAAAALAGALRLAEDQPGDIGVLLTGGNVDPAVVSRVLNVEAGVVG
jgi:threo-3-hydroxy-L-aspartate ammonia-lyase